MLLDKIKFAAKYYFDNTSRESLDKCPLCSSSLFYFFTRKREGAIFVKLYECKKCKHVFQNPRLSSIGLKRYYEYDYRKFRGEVDNAHQFERECRKGNNIKLFLSEYGIDTSMMKILEVGSARGGILYSLSGQNPELVSGVEWDIECREYSNSKNVKSFSELSEVHHEFDMIILNHVFEHVPDLEGFLLEIKSHLKANGLLFIEVPGRGEKFRRSIQLAHLHYFTKDILKELVVKNGFSCIVSDDKIRGLFKKI